jgi:hypothetical protein
MKKIQILAIFFLISISNLNAQLTDVITLSSFPQGLSLNGNDLYIAGPGLNVIKIDITESSPSQTNVVTAQLQTARYIAISGNELYISENAGSKISKINITESSPTPTDVITGLIGPWGLLIDGNDLYIGRDNKISKIDITNSSPTATDVVTGLIGPYNFALNGNDLYVAEIWGGKISKIDLNSSFPTPLDIVTGLNQPIDIEFYGNELYIAEDDKISKINITDSTPIAIEVVTGLNSPSGLALDGNDLYVSEYFASKILKIALNELSLNEYSLKKNIKIIPNPTSDYIMISGLNESENYTIYNLLGKELKKGSISDNNKIDIRSFSNGLYILRFNNGRSIKLIKE